MAKKNNGRDFLVGSLVGGLVGAATALFLAPKSGKEIRDNLGQQANVMKDRTGQLTNTALEKSSDLAAMAKDKTSSLSQVVTEQSSQIMDKVRSITKATNSADESEVIEREITEALEEITDGSNAQPEEEQDRIKESSNQENEQLQLQEVTSPVEESTEEVKTNS